MNKNFYFFLIILLLSSFTRINNINNFYTETDDQISISQLLKYNKTDLYEIANEKESPSYNSNFKKIIRKVESYNSPIINKSQSIISDMIFNMSPSKHSTFAPLQYLIFGWMIDETKNYKELKFYSRIPSAIFSILSVFIIFIISTKLFQNNFLIFLPTIFTITSFPLIYISQRSYNYSAGSFAMLVLIYIFLSQYRKEKNSCTVLSDKINFWRNFRVSLIISLLSYLNYMMLLFTPLYYLTFFLKDLINKKSLFSILNINLIISGIIYIFTVIPLLLYMFKLNLNEYGMTGSTAGESYEYSITSISSNDFLSYINFYFQNIYLIIVKNLAFYLDDFKFSFYFEILIFITFIYGLIKSIFFTKNKNLRFIIFIISGLFLYWCILAFFNITALGPTRHLNIFTSLFSIILSYGVFNILKFFKNEILNIFIKFFFIFIVILVFIINYSDFTYKYFDQFDEDRINKIIKNENVKLIINDGTHSDVLCLMKLIDVQIYTCPEGLKRYNYNPEISLQKLRKIKLMKGSVAKINIFENNIYNGELINNNLIINNKLKQAGFQLKYKKEEIRFGNISPLYISKYKPNIFTFEILD